MWHHRSQMALYFVTMKVSEPDPDDPVLPLEGLTAVLRKAVLPTLEALLDLKQRMGKEVLGGYLSGQQSVVLIMEADSEEEVYEVLEGLPVWAKANTEVARLRFVEDLQGG
jgi:hypothetical protein